MPDHTTGDGAETLLSDADMPEGGAATAEVDTSDAPEPSDEGGFTGRGGKQAEKARAERERNDRRLDNAEKHARDGTMPKRNDDGSYDLDGEAETKPAKSADKPRQDRDTEDEEEGGEEADGKDAADEVDQDQLRRARRALLRDGYEPEDLKDWTAERILKLGTERAKRQDKTEKYVKELRTKAGIPADPGREEADELEQQQDSPAGESLSLADLLFPGTAQEKSEGPTHDLSDVLGTLNDEEQAKVKGAIKSHQDHLRDAVDRYGKNLSRAQQTAAKAVTRAVSLSLRAAQSELLDELPMLRDPKKWSAVLRELSSLDRDREVIFTEDQSVVTKLVRKAAFAAYGSEIVSQARTKQAQTAHRERTSVPHEGAAPSKSTRVSKEKYMKLAQQAAEKFPGEDSKAREYLNELLRKE